MGLVLRRDGIRNLVKQHGREAFANTFVDWLREGKIKADDVSIRDLWEGVIGPVEETLGHAHQGRDGKLNFIGPRKLEGLASTAFPVMTGALIASKAIEGYNSVQDISDRLCTVVPSNKKVDIFPGFTADEGPEEVEEGEEYEDTKFGEKFVTADAKKRGRILSVTEETIIFDQMGNILMKARMRGEKMKLDRMRRIIRAIIDYSGTVYKPSGTATALYSVANGNLVGSNALVDYENIDTVLKASALQRDENGDEIDIPMPDLLVPRALWTASMRITQATSVRVTGQANDPERATYSPAPFAGVFAPLHSVLLDRHSTTNWFMGDFKRAFGYKEIYPIQTIAAMPGGDKEFERDIKYRFKVREYGDPFCFDHRLVYKSQVAAAS